MIYFEIQCKISCDTVKMSVRKISWKLRQISFQIFANEYIYKTPRPFDINNTYPKRMLKIMNQFECIEISVFQDSAYHTKKDKLCGGKNSPIYSKQYDHSRIIYLFIINN